MKALNRRRMVAIQFFALDALLGGYLPISGFLISPLLYRLDKRIFHLANGYLSVMFISQFLKPQNFLAQYSLFRALALNLIDKKSLAVLPNWALSPLFVITVLCLQGVIFFLGGWLEAWAIDRFYLWKRMKNLFARWGELR